MSSAGEESGRKPMRMTPAKLRAQRANARLAHGPRTEEGRRRSALNRRSINFGPTWLAEIRRSGSDPKDFLRLWRDLLAQFWFVDRELGLYLELVAWAWWLKLVTARSGSAEWRNEEIERQLAEFVERFRSRNQMWSYWLDERFGRDCARDMRRLRESVEARLTAFRKISHTGGPPFES